MYAVLSTYKKSNHNYNTTPINNLEIILEL